MNRKVYILLVLLSGMSSIKRSIKISDKLKDYLDKNSVSRRQTYEDVIWMMLGAKTLTQQQKAEAKSNYEELL